MKLIKVKLKNHSLINVLGGELFTVARKVAVGNRRGGVQRAPWGKEGPTRNEEAILESQPLAFTAI